MNKPVIELNIADRVRPLVRATLDRLRDYGFDVRVHVDLGLPADEVRTFNAQGRPAVTQVEGTVDAAVDAVLAGWSCDFEPLPLLAEGESKIVRRLTDTLVVERFKPTVYSFTQNRYGIAEGTDDVRAQFSAATFRHLRAHADMENAFVALIDIGGTPHTIQRAVQPCNLEVRVKRYHIGSPLHRYKYTANHDSVFGPPLARWFRFPAPVGCFDWRHPLHDEDGNRLADEPLPDDYAACWIEDVPKAKRTARTAFVALEALFRTAGLTLIDICFFIDRTGKIIFGEISPDCMRIRSAAAEDNPRLLDKDAWRAGCTPLLLRERYEELFQKVFATQTAQAYVLETHS